MFKHIFLTLIRHCESNCVVNHQIDPKKERKVQYNIRSWGEMASFKAPNRYEIQSIRYKDSPNPWGHVNHRYSQLKKSYV